MVARSLAIAVATGLMLLPADGGTQAPSDGYVGPGFDVLAVLPPAPLKGDARYKADREIFKATRALAGSPRWAMATGDVKLGQADLLRDYSCALGAELTPAQAPATMALIGRGFRDVGRATGIAKDHFQRLRPFQIDQGPICQPAEQLKGSYDYPSGHTSMGWTWATLLAAAAPDRASAILARGRAFGESRIVCGVHNASAVEAGRLTASAVLAAAEGNPQFGADLAAARAELARLRADPATPRPDPARCQAEAALVAQPLLPPAR